jgi:NAD(P)-dependent dehydrogenase (short-subunit alcohol dehydrogenase family)
MTNPTVLITGANSGVGFAAAQVLAQRGARVLMLCRDRGRGEDARAQLRTIATGPAPRLYLADLASQHEIRRVAEEIRDDHAHIDVLLNNAGGVFNKRELTVDGIERTTATNHLAPFLLTNLLLEAVLAAPRGRVVTVASEVHAKRIDFANLQSERGHQFFKAYQRSKLCNILFAFELSRRLQGTSATSNAVSPGPSRTRFGDNLTGAAGVLPKVMKRMPVFGSPEKGAQTLVYAATAAELDGASGRFFLKSKEYETKPVTHDRELAVRLWRHSEQLCGLVPALEGAERSA